MAYEMKVDGMAEISELLEKMDEEAPVVAARALYEGAAVMQKGLTDAALKIKTAPFKYAKGGEMRLPSPEEKQIVLDAGVGVARFDKNGTEINTSVGYNTAGYADVNWNHMSSKGRTNYKSKHFKKHDSNSTSYLKASGQYERGLQNQKPVGAIANAINSGTSFMQKQPFVRKAANTGANKAMSAMKESIQEAFDKMNK